MMADPRRRAWPLAPRAHGDSQQASTHGQAAHVARMCGVAALRPTLSPPRRWVAVADTGSAAGIAKRGMAAKRRARYATGEAASQQQEEGSGMLARSFWKRRGVSCSDAASP
eukprot:364300-Chlamydomonas_euryale.AAC.7